MTRIIRLESSNVKRLKAVAIDPEPIINRIGGENGAGKSSLLDSIAMALSGSELTEAPLRQGEKKGSIVVKLDDGITIKRTFNASGGTSLTISNAEGLKYPSPQAMLDKLTGKLMFDPFEFTRLKPKEQSEALKRLVGLDFTSLDAARAAKYNERTLINRDVDRARARADGLPAFPEAPAAPISTADLLESLQNIQAHNAKQFALKKHLSERIDAFEDGERGVGLLRAEIAKLEALLVKRRAELTEQETAVAAHKTTMEAAKLAVESFVVQSEAEVKTALAGATNTNHQVESNKAKAEALKIVADTQARADALTKAIADIDEQKTKDLAAAKFPIEGLSFGDAGVTYKGLPFSEASTAEKIRISVAMGAALNPKLRVMLVRDGSLLDKKSMALLADLAAQHQLQVFIEVAGDGAGCEVVIEDGTVKGTITIPNDADFEVAPADAEPAPAQAATAPATEDAFKFSDD